MNFKFITVFFAYGAIASSLQLPNADIVPRAENESKQQRYNRYLNEYIDPQEFTSGDIYTNWYKSCLSNCYMHYLNQGRRDLQSTCPPACEEEWRKRRAQKKIDAEAAEGR